MASWISTEEAATRLGVKPATLYAYVSRGVLRRRTGADGRSRFDPAEVEQLARRGRPRRQPGPAEFLIESGITALGADRPYYRGLDALDLAARHHPEEVAPWLWTGDGAALAGTTEWSPWAATPGAVAAAVAAQSGLPPPVLPLERLAVITPVLAAADPVRLNLDPPTVAAVGQSLIAGMVDALPAVSRPPDSRTGGRIADRLWGKLTGQPVGPLTDVLRAALVVMADHELASSTLAARVAASVRVDPYGVVSAALGVVGGALHGGASLGVETMLAEMTEPDRVRYGLGQRLRRGERIPGFGHTVYRGADGRGTFLLDRVRAAAPGHDRLAVAEAVLAEVHRRRLPAVNVDFALAVLGSVAGMVTGAGEVIFAVARTVGWLAHAGEEYAHPTRLRPRALYTGPAVPSGRSPTALGGASPTA